MSTYFKFSTPIPTNNVNSLQINSENNTPAFTHSYQLILNGSPVSAKIAEKPGQINSPPKREPETKHIFYVLDNNTKYQYKTTAPNKT